MADKGLSMEELTALLKSLGVESLSEFPNGYPGLNPIDIYRAHIAEIVGPLVDVAPEIIYPALQWTQSLDKGDLVLPIPALRLKGKSPADVSKTISEQVGVFSVQRESLAT